MEDDAGGAPCPHCGSQHEPGQTCPSAEPSGQVPGSGSDPLVGSMVGSFRVTRLLGRGGMGAVYLGEHPVIGSKVAIKFLHESMDTSPELVNRFYDEARAVNRIGHENIVGIFDLSMLPPNRYYIVMEYLTPGTRGEVDQAALGRGLAERLPEGRIEEVRVVAEPISAARLVDHFAVPARLGDLGVLATDLPARVLRGERDHQRVRERPRLAAEPGSSYAGDPSWALFSA